MFYLNTSIKLYRNVDIICIMSIKFLFQNLKYRFWWIYSQNLIFNSYDKIGKNR